jgi:hypothetical protein
MTKEELLNKTNHSLTMKDLRKFVEANKDLDDESPVVVERVTDLYFEGSEWNAKKIDGWAVLRREGYHYHNSLEWNKRMQEEIERRELGEKPEYERLENPYEAFFGEKELEEMKEQFYQPHCITTDSEIVYIYSHY